MRQGVKQNLIWSQLSLCGDEKQATEIGHQSTEAHVQRLLICQNTTKLGHCPKMLKHKMFHLRNRDHLSGVVLMKLVKGGRC